MNRNSGGPGVALCAGIVAIIVATLNIITPDDGSYINICAISIGRKLPLVDWIGWLFLPIGIALCIMSIIALRRGEGKPKKYTDAEVAQAKEALDRMYLKEHGSLPKSDRKEDPQKDA